MTEKMAYLIVYPFVIGTMGAILGYLMSGTTSYLRHGKWQPYIPKSFKDYYYIDTGRTNPDGTPEKVALPTYMKDYFAFTAHPVKAVESWVHPLWTSTEHMLNNEDYYGVEIVHRGDPAVQQVEEFAKGLVKEFSPISVQMAIQRFRSGAGFEGFAESEVGLSPAPKYVVESPALQLAAEYQRTHFGTAARTTEQAEHSRLKNQLVLDIQNGRDEDGKRTGEVQDALNKGELTSTDRKAAMRTARETPLQRRLTEATTEQVFDVWDIADAKERADMSQKFQSALRNLGRRPIGEQEQVLPRIQSMIDQKTMIADGKDGMTGAEKSHEMTTDDVNVADELKAKLHNRRQEPPATSVGAKVRSAFSPPPPQ